MVTPTLKTQIHTHEHQQPHIVDLSDGDSNKVFQVNNKYIYKEFFSKAQLSYETTGCLIFNMLSSYGVPMLLDKGDDYLVMEFVRSDSCFNLHREGRVSREEVGQKVTMFMAEVYWNYRFFNREKIKLFPHMSWEDRLYRILSHAKKNFIELSNILTSEQMKLVRQTQSDLEILIVPIKSLTFLHRDLHLDNVLVRDHGVGRDRNYFIDFEHCMEGPIEFELQNSIFWNDAWSLPVDSIRRSLQYDHDISYSLELEQRLLGLYYIDQLNLALDKHDVLKVIQLAEVFDHRIQKTSQ